MNALLLVPGLALLFCGLFGLLLRRSLMAVLISFNVVMLGCILVVVSSANGSVEGQAAAFILACITLLFSILGGAQGVALYRRKGTLNLDEQRELRG